MKQISMKAARTNACIPQSAMAKELGVGRNKYIDWEMDRKPIPRDKFEQFCAACGFSTKAVRANVIFVAKS